METNAEKLPIHAAIKAGKPIADIDALIRAGANPNEPDEHGRTPLHVCIAEMRDDIAVHLLEQKKGGKPLVDQMAKDKDGNTPLHFYASRSGPNGGVTVLSKGGKAFYSQAIFVPNNKGETPLHVAISQDNMFVFTFFVGKLSDRYYGKIDLDNPVFKTGPEGDSLVFVALKRLLLKDMPDNLHRTYTMLYLLAGEVPEMFSAGKVVSRARFGADTLQTPLQFAQANHLSSRFIKVIENADDIFMRTFGELQVVGQMQKTIGDLKNEVSGLMTRLDLAERKLASKEDDMSPSAEKPQMQRTSSQFFPKQ